METTQPQETMMMDGKKPSEMSPQDLVPILQKLRKLLEQENQEQDSEEKEIMVVDETPASWAACDPDQFK